MKIEDTSAFSEKSGNPMKSQDSPGTPDHIFTLPTLYLKPLYLGSDPLFASFQFLIMLIPICCASCWESSSTYRMWTQKVEQQNKVNDALFENLHLEDLWSRLALI